VRDRQRIVPYDALPLLARREHVAVAKMVAPDVVVAKMHYSCVLQVSLAKGCWAKLPIGGAEEHVARGSRSIQVDQHGA